MSSVGETLRAERLSKKFSLEQIARETKINSHLLDAIETNQFDLLPRGVFAKSFVRQYARFLGLDEEEMAAEEAGRSGDQDLIFHLSFFVWHFSSGKSCLRRSSNSSTARM